MTSARVFELAMSMALAGLILLAWGTGLEIVMVVRAVPQPLWVSAMIAGGGAIMAGALTVAAVCLIRELWGGKS